ncbi:hypothetical protein FFLO_03858 [Filobasidium floriforme]|uniref:GH16 domain-containing protein n=1 Tax=Filobasidium floriforme TaxID=5210 RepID=A0A8K0JL96_9TREE|nr:putative beta-glucan synthesis-associated protein SKN1 [Filobasidium floriforme]KAG7532050.1 hypothetical protein FFLO_03858 [Filobasidium floriforme]KAH8078620.1 putative beta-glucan synthesis-associated protein SKN1 [Filobasidium floriforme]
MPFLGHSRPGSAESGERLVRSGGQWNGSPAASSLSLAHGGEQYTHDGSADILAQLDAQPLEEWEKRVEEKESIKWSSARGWMNMGTIFILCGGIVAVFLGVPIVKEYNKKTAGANVSGYNLGGINATGQFASIGRDLIDPDTPSDAYTRTGFDGNQWNLVFSDEFELDGRTFFPGDDPYWEAVDLHYWGTNDYEWYDPRAITTRDGKLVITLSETVNHNLNYTSGMLQSWNKLCFSGSMYYEAKLLLPGNNEIGGFWPGVWAFGNLGRPGYGATTDGTWPYSYDSCDVGILPNQTYLNGTGPDAALHNPADGTALSYLPGMRWPSCTCPGEDHPGPDVSIGRGVPEVDMIEAQVLTDRKKGEVSQTLQIAPYDENWKFDNASSDVANPDLTYWNTYTGGVYQQSCSGLTIIPDDVYQETGGVYTTYGYELYANKDDRSNGYITWVADGVESWTLHAPGLAPNPGTEVGQRLIPEEPMALVLNLGLSDNFQWVDKEHLKFPAEMQFEYIRVYQREDYGSVGCDPKDYPTADYIARHADAYNNPNLTTWAQTGSTVPKNRLRDGC